MSAKATRKSMENDNLCVLCFKTVEIYSIGSCDHSVCYECSTRMRVLCKQNECPICRGDLPKVIFAYHKEPYTSLFTRYSRGRLQDVKFGIIFANQDIQNAYHKLLEHRCPICPHNHSVVFRTFSQLKDHMRREHEQFYCDICVENVMIFSSERRTYTRQELGLHRRKGDPDNTSHRGHPLCEFCDTRFMDSDELFRHMRRTHLFCHLCDADGKHLYYRTVEDLQKHFREEHFLCEEGECRSVPMASAFRTEIDLKAHIAAIHGRNLTKNVSKQVRTLEFEFTLAPRSNNRKKREERSSVEEEGAVGYDAPEGAFQKPLTPTDFPALGGVAQAQIRPVTTFTSKTNPKLNFEEFPSLGNNKKTTSGLTITTSRNSEVSISRNSNDFPALGKPSTSRESRVFVNVHNNTAPQVSISLNHKSNGGGGFRTQITTAASGGPQNAAEESFPALPPPSKTPSNHQPQWVQLKSKKQPDKSSKVAAAPQLPPPQWNTTTKGKSNKKTSTIQVPVTNNWLQANNNNINDDESNKNDKTKKKKKPKGDETIVAENGTETTKKTTSRPPGFAVAPPPGFTRLSGDFPELSAPNDLTFTTSSGQSYAITSAKNNYKQPTNFSTRNQNVIKKLSMVSSDDTIANLKHQSELFRNDNINAEKYYECCRRILGANFDEFFPEMLVLLPDVQKQEALYNVYNGKSKKSLTVCQQCRQVIYKKELKEHYDRYHVLENRFTSQVTTNVSNNNVWDN